MLQWVSGMDLQFEWEEVDAFVRQPDGSLFSWCERFRCYRHLIYGIVSHSTYNDSIILHTAFSCLIFIILCLILYLISLAF